MSHRGGSAQIFVLLAHSLFLKAIDETQCLRVQVLNDVK